MDKPPIWVIDPERLAAAEHERETQRKAKPNGKAEPHFVLVRSKDVKLDTRPRCIVDGLIPKDGLVVIWGPPKCGKSFWTFDLVMHPALGWDYRGHAVEQGAVVYIACEGEQGLAARNAAFRQDKLSDDDDPPFYLLTTRLNLPAQIDLLAADIAAQVPEETCAAIVLDTLNRSIGGSESSDEDMAKYIGACDALRDKFKCAVVIIHHCGINDTRPRGHTSLSGAADAQIAISRDTKDRVIATIEYMKDSAIDEPMVSTLRVVNVGIDDNGKPITSLVVDPDVGPILKKQRRITLPPGCKIALKQLKNLLATEGHAERVPESPNVKAGTFGINKDQWKRGCYQAGISDGASDSSRRMAFERAAKRLIADEIVSCWGEWVWIP
jgi:hypothetical protein